MPVACRSTRRAAGLPQGMLLLVMLLAASSVSAQSAVDRVRRAPVRDGNVTFQRRVLSWREIKTQHVVMQQRDYSCGAAALATVLRYYWGHDVSEADVLDVVERLLTAEQLAERAQEGLTLADLQDAAVEMGYQASAGTLELAQLAESKVPVVVAVNWGGTNHFVVYRGLVAGCVFLADPLRGNMRIAAETFDRIWIGNAVLVVAPPDQTQSQRSQLGIRAEEVYRGFLNNQVIRRQLTGPAVAPLRTVP